MVTENTDDGQGAPSGVRARHQPGATLGHHMIALAAWFHYGLGITIAQVVDILGHPVQTALTPGGWIDAWPRF